MAKKKLTSKKAKEILHDKSVHGHPLTDKQRKFFGAVASGYIKAQKGKTTKKDDEKPVYTELTDMPEIVILNQKDPATKALYDAELNALPTNEGNPFSTVDKFADYYAKMQMAKQFGAPKVRPAEPLGSFANWARERSGISTPDTETWPTYNPFTQTVNADFGKYREDYIPELAHHYNQIRAKDFESKIDYLKGGLKNLLAYTIGDDPYKVRGTEENTAHEMIEPYIQKRYLEAKTEGRKYASKEAKNAFRRTVYERKKAQNGVEGTMGGLTDVGFNYNSAWGGQWQMGGSLPGATGMMYARVGAPSNGKYAKKTKASAQNGKEMQFYQQGLDFQPKTISEDGAIIDPMGQWAHPGEITQIPSNDITMEGVPYDVLGISNTGDTKLMKPGKKYKFKGDSVTEYPIAQNGSRQDKGQLKKLDQLTNFTNYNKMAKKGIKKAQWGTPGLMDQLGLNLASYKKGMIDSPTGVVTKQQTQQLGFDDLGNRAGGLDASGLISAGTDVVRGFQQLKQDKQNYRKAKQFSQLAGITAKAATTREQAPKKKYIRPEDMLLSNDNFNTMPYGSGYDVLSSAKEGMQIGGNLTEIQNMYNPGTLYNDLGYEPLDESSRVKQFAGGGNLFSSDFFSGVTSADAGTFGGFLGSAIGGNKGRTSGAGSIGKGLGSVAGTIIGGPVGGMIGSAAGGFIGDLIGGQQAAKAEQQMKQAERQLNQAAIQQGVGALQNQFSGFMKDGGEAGLKYLSNDWQPQVITTFGDYKLKDLLAPPHDADMLRTGGNIRQNYISDDEKLSMMQMGGELQTHWGGGAETMSYNPYLGETVMFKGQSHEESDGRGRTGIGITFGENPVEVERNEPAVKLKDGGTGQDSLVVYGDMFIPSYGASELNDPKAKGMKFKHYVKELSKDEIKQNNKKDKAVNLLDNISGDGPFDLLKLNSAQATLTGVDMNLKNIANKKRTAAGIQSAILDTAEEMGLESSDLAKGKIKQTKNKNGRAQDGTIKLPSQELIQIPTTPAGPFKFGPYRIEQDAPDFEKRWDDYVYNKPMQVNAPYASPEAEARAKQMMANQKAAQTSTVEEETSTTPAKQPGFFKQLSREILPYVRPSNRLPLDPSQLSGEMYALATNILEPVQAQTYQPMLKTIPARRSAQQSLNQNQLTFNALARQIGGNPQALAQLAAQKYDADKNVINQIEDYNRAAEMQTVGENIATLNDATLKNLAILDTQYQRQAGAKSATKAQAQAALNSIASKIAQNQLENRTVGVYENLYNYRFTPSGVAYNVNAPAEFSIPNIADYSSEELLKLAKEKKEKESKSSTARNGNIVKAIKNL